MPAADSSGEQSGDAAAEDVACSRTVASVGSIRPNTACGTRQWMVIRSSPNCRERISPWAASQARSRPLPASVSTSTSRKPRPSAALAASASRSSPSPDLSDVRATEKDRGGRKVHPAPREHRAVHQRSDAGGCHPGMPQQHLCPSIDSHDGVERTRLRVDIELEEDFFHSVGCLQLGKRSDQFTLWRSFYVCP